MSLNVFRTGAERNQQALRPLSGLVYQKAIASSAIASSATRVPLSEQRHTVHVHTPKASDEAHRERDRHAFECKSSASCKGHKATNRLPQTSHHVCVCMPPNIRLAFSSSCISRTPCSVSWKNSWGSRSCNQAQVGGFCRLVP